MTTKKRGVSSSRATFLWCSLLSFIFVVLIFMLPANKATIASYHMTSFEYNIALMMVNLPLILIWFIAFWGYQKLRQYALLIQDSPEGHSFSKLALGVEWLAWSLPITAIIARLLNGIYAATPSFHPTQVILINYVNLLLPFIAFVIIGSAARGIIGSSKLDLSLWSSRFIMLFFAIGGLAYCYLTLKSFDLSSLSSSKGPFFLPVWLMVLTIIIPYLYGWFIGLLAAFEISLYAKQMSGVLYKRPLFMLVTGLVFIIFSFIASQYVSTVWPVPKHLIFDYRLVVYICFRIIGGVGFILLTVGANRLKRIEEV